MVVYTLEQTLGSGPVLDLQKMPTVAKKVIFSDEVVLILKLSHLGHREPTRMY